VKRAAPIALGAHTPRASSSWRVRPAHAREAPAVVAAVVELLRELGATPPAAPAMQAAALKLIEDPCAGAVLVAVSDREEIVGVLGASFQSAMHAPGRYALIQDLWVRRSWRGAGAGAGMLAALFELARAQGAAGVEVGLPRERFAGLAATEAFYRASGFDVLGARMRRSLA
jgi:GNAT superfamily N-acetyltransferase